MQRMRSAAGGTVTLHGINGVNDGEIGSYGLSQF